MVVGPDAVSAEDQESASEHETEDHPNSLTNDLVNSRQLVEWLDGLRSTPGIQ